MSTVHPLDEATVDIRLGNTLQLPNENGKSSNLAQQIFDFCEVALAGEKVRAATIAPVHFER
jgi:hypothetical protein